MTNIRERLRKTELWQAQDGIPEPDCWFVSTLGLEAAAEIERLTAEGKTWHDCYDNERRDNERLRADWKPDRGSLVEYRLLAEAQDDNKRLTDALTKIRSVVGTSTEAWLIANRALEPKP